MGGWEITERERIKQDIIDCDLSYTDQFYKAIDEQQRMAGAGSHLDGRDVWNNDTRIEILRELISQERGE